MRIRKHEMWVRLCKTERRNWLRGWGHHYLGKVTSYEYQWDFTWDAWTYRTPRTRESVVVLARHTKCGTLRVVTYHGIGALNVLDQRKRKEKG